MGVQSLSLPNPTEDARALANSRTSQLSPKGDEGKLDYREQLALLWSTARREQQDNLKRSNEDRRLTGKRRRIMCHWIALSDMYLDNPCMHEIFHTLL